jgi:NAD(P)-dependent dehydrogenase (short-subunit alcohol dehydrogenase family)
MAIGCDVTAEAQVEAMAARTVGVLGGLDILVNNAGIADPQALFPALAAARSTTRKSVTRSLPSSPWAGSPRPPRLKGPRSSSPQPHPAT